MTNFYKMMYIVPECISRSTLFHIEIQYFFICSDLIIIREGKETDEFWEFLGGKEEYASMPRLAVSVKKSCLTHSLRMFLNNF